MFCIFTLLLHRYTTQQFWLIILHSWIRGVFIQSYSARAKNVTNYVFFHFYPKHSLSKAHISAPFFLSKQLGPASSHLTVSSSLKRIIGAEIQALFLWSVLYCRAGCGVHFLEGIALHLDKTSIY